MVLSFFFSTAMVTEETLESGYLKDPLLSHIMEIMLTGEVVSTTNPSSKYLVKFYTGF